MTGETGGRPVIRDVFPLKVERNEVVTEGVAGSSGKRRVLKIGGRFQMADAINANSRIYPRAVLEQATAELEPDIKARGVLGEYDHPPDAKVHLDRISHLITKVWMEGNEVFGECEILEGQPLGAQLKNLVESNVRVGISSRGVGDMETCIHENQECYKVMPGYQFITFDIVAEPSVRGSFMKPVNEGLIKKARFSNKKNREAELLKIVTGKQHKRSYKC